MISDDIDLSRTTGWFTSLFPIYLNMRCTSDHESLIKSVKEQVRKIPDKGLSYGVLRYLTQKEGLGQNLNINGMTDVVFNYLGAETFFDFLEKLHLKVLLIRLKM